MHHYRARKRKRKREKERERECVCVILDLCLEHITHRKMWYDGLVGSACIAAVSFLMASFSFPDKQ